MKTILDIMQAIQTIRPNAEFTQTGLEYSDLIWNDNLQIKPTEEEFTTAVAEIQNIKIAKKTTAEAKLQALGLTTDDLKALGLGGN